MTRWLLVVVTLVIFMRSDFDLATCWCWWQDLQGLLRGVNLRDCFLQLILCHTKSLSESYACVNHSSFFVAHTEASGMELIAIQHFTGDGRSCVILLPMA